MKSIFLQDCYRLLGGSKSSHFLTLLILSYLRKISVSLPSH